MGVLLEFRGGEKSDLIHRVLFDVREFLSQLYLVFANKKGGLNI